MMTSMKSLLSATIVLTSISWINALPGKAFENTPFDTKGVSLPFPNTPKGFQDAANKWWNEDSGDYSYKFWDVGKDSKLGAPCVVRLDEWGGYAHLYCGGGYVYHEHRTRNYTKTSTCKLSSTKGLQYSLNPSVGFNVTYTTYGCKWN